MVNKRHRAGGIGQHAHDGVGRTGELPAQPPRRSRRARSTTASGSSPRPAGCAGPPATGPGRWPLGFGQRQAGGGGDHQVGGDGADGRTGGGRAQQATSSGTPMKPVFGKAATRAPKAASFNCTSGAERHRDREDPPSAARTQQVDGQHGRVQHLEAPACRRRSGTACTAARSTARRRSAPGSPTRAARAGAPPGSRTARGEEGRGDGEDRLMGVSARCAAPAGRRRCGRAVSAGRARLHEAAAVRRLRAAASTTKRPARARAPGAG
jgi:hypothetical protein